MKKKNKYLLAGWLLFLIPLAFEIVNIYLALTVEPTESNREALGMLFYWCMFLAFPQMAGLALMMFGYWGDKPRKNP